MICCFMFSLFSCKQEVPVQNTETDIRFDPLGQFEEVRLCVNVNNETNYLLTDLNQLYKTKGHYPEVEWKTPLPLYAKGIVPCKNESVIALTTSYFGYDLMSISRFGSDGNMQYSFPFDKFFDEYPNHFEHFITACSDGKNGAYILVALLEAGKWPGLLQKDEVFLVHLDDQNNFTKIKLNDYYIRIASDPNGNLFGLRYQERYFNIQGAGEPDSFYIEAFDQTKLSQGIISKTWSSGFSQIEYYTNYYWDLEFNLSVNSRYVYYAMPLVRYVDIQYGHEMVALDRTNGKEVHHKTLESPTYVDVYLSNTWLNGFANEDGFFTQYSIGATTRLMHMNMEGNLAKHMDLKGTNNRCEISSLSDFNSEIWLWGKMSKGKNAQMVPFFQKLDIK